MAAAKGGLSDNELVLVHIAHDIVGDGGLIDIAQVFVFLPFADHALVALLVSGSRKMLHYAVGSITVSIVADKAAAVLTGFLANDDVGAGHAELPACQEN